MFTTYLTGIWEVTKHLNVLLHYSNNGPWIKKFVKVRAGSIRACVRYGLERCSTQSLLSCHQGKRQSNSRPIKGCSPKISRLSFKGFHQNQRNCTYALNHLLIGGEIWAWPSRNVQLHARQGLTVSSVSRFGSSCSPWLEPVGLLSILPFWTILFFGSGLKNV